MAAERGSEAMGAQPAGNMSVVFLWDMTQRTDPVETAAPKPLGGGDRCAGCRLPVKNRVLGHALMEHGIHHDEFRMECDSFATVASTWCGDQAC